MAELKHTEIFNCKPKQLFDLVIDYEKYPEFLSEVDSCKVIEQSGDHKKVEYCISLIKTFRYILEQKEVPFAEVSWTFLEGDLFKKMQGHWKLKEKGDQTEVEYFVQAEFGLFVPKMMTKTILSVNLPVMMESYHRRLTELYGG